MSAATTLARGRAKALQLMVDTVTVTRVTGTSTNSDTGVVTPTTSVIYTGACKVQQAAASGSPTDVGEAERMASQLVLHLPMTVTGVTADDVATVTASVNDPDLVGKTFTVRAPMHKSFATARRFPLQELSS